MKIRSVNVGLPRRVVSEGNSVTTGIFKTPVHRRVKVGMVTIEGDGQADLSVHGGPNKAVYAYPSEHYDFWRREFPGMNLPWGMFGENLTLEGLLEDDVSLGGQFRMGTAALTITQPRLPCFKLGIKFCRDDIIDRFLASGRSGFYLAVAEEGDLGEGETVKQISRDPNQLSIPNAFRLYTRHNEQDIPLFERALQVEALPSRWRQRFMKKLDELGK